MESGTASKVCRRTLGSCAGHAKAKKSVNGEYEYKRTVSTASSDDVATFPTSPDSGKSETSGNDSSLNFSQWWRSQNCQPLLHNRKLPRQVFQTEKKIEMRHRLRLMQENRRIRERSSQKIEKYTTCLHRATKVLKINTTQFETNLCGKSPINDAYRRLSTPINAYHGCSQNRR